MISILTDNEDQYQILINHMKEDKVLLQAIARPDNQQIKIYHPNDCMAAVIWSVEDVRHLFPTGTPDEILVAGFNKVAKQLREQITQLGNEIINDNQELIESVLTERRK